MKKKKNKTKINKIKMNKIKIKTFSSWLSTRNQQHHHFVPCVCASVRICECGCVGEVGWGLSGSASSRLLCILHCSCLFVHFFFLFFPPFFPFFLDYSDFVYGFHCCCCCCKFFITSISKCDERGGATTNHHVTRYKSMMCSSAIRNWGG